jgi:CBS domain-containing protein
MNFISTILKTKSSNILTVTPDTSTYDALQIMADNNVGALLVVKGENLVGIFSERDYARKVVLKGKTSRDTKVSEMMTTNVLYIGPNCTIDECMALMTKKRIRHIPVMEDNKLIGVVSIGDVVKQIISEHESTIQQLENYITGSY